MSRGRGGSSASITALSTQTVTVNYFTADGTAIAKEDYVATQGVLTYAPGETLKKIVIEMPKDKKVEDIVEAFFVELVNASANAVILKRGVVHVVDDDLRRATAVRRWRRRRGSPRMPGRPRSGRSCRSPSAVATMAMPMMPTMMTTTS